MNGFRVVMLLVVFAFAVHTPVLVAENIPPQILEAYGRQCESECATNAMMSGRCTPFCACRVREAQEKLSFEGLLDIKVASDIGQPMPEKYARLEAEILKTCMLEAFKSKSG